MAAKEFIALNESTNELQAPQIGDTYVANRAAVFNQPVTFNAVVNGRNTVADAVLLDAALQPGDNISVLVNDILASQGEAQAGVNNTRMMTPLRVAQAIAVLAAGVKNNYTGSAPPVATDDAAAGYSAGSVWLDLVADEAYRCLDPSTNIAIWINTTLTTTELAAVALSGNSDDLTQGATKLLLTVAERALIASAIQPSDSKYGILVTLSNVTAEAVVDATPRKIAAWNTNGLSSGMVPDHTADRITINSSGVFTASLSLSFSGTGNKTYHIELYKNGASAGFILDHKLGTGGDVVAVSLKGIFSCVPTDTIEVYQSSSDGGIALTVTNSQLLVVKEGY